MCMGGMEFKEGLDKFNICFYNVFTLSQRTRIHIMLNRKLIFKTTKKRFRGR